jgi:hypothetical protein
MSKTHYIDCLIKKLGIDNSLRTPTYNRRHLRKRNPYNHTSVLHSFGISIKDEERDLPSLNCIPKLHKFPYKQCYTAGSAKCFTKPLLKTLTYIISAVKIYIQSYCDTNYSSRCVNQMLILKIF